MSAILFSTIIGLGILLAGFSPAAKAEQFVAVYNSAKVLDVVEIDIDSIRKGERDLVYYTDKSAFGLSHGAADCKGRKLYTLESEFGSEGHMQPMPDWEKQGRPVKKGTKGDTLLTFICSRVR